MSIDFTLPTSHRVGQQLLRDGGEQKTHVYFAWFVSFHSDDDSLLSTGLPKGIYDPGRVENDGGRAVREYCRVI